MPRGRIGRRSPAVALLSLREPVSSPRRQRRKHRDEVIGSKTAAVRHRARRARRAERGGWRPAGFRRRRGAARARDRERGQRARPAGERSPPAPARWCESWRASAGRVRRRRPAARSTIERFDDATQAWASRGDRHRCRRRRLPRALACRRRRRVPRPRRARAVRPGGRRPAPRPSWRSRCTGPRWRPGTGPASTAAGPRAASRMTRSLLGVAHKSLPCGTQVAVLYKGRRITVPVVDRGPFRRGTRWDLTAATAERARLQVHRSPRRRPRALGEALRVDPSVAADRGSARG